MIQILGLRDWTREGKVSKREVFFEKGYRLEKVQDAFNPETLDALLARIPDEEKYNLYFTVADCFEETGRKLREQWAIPFDIDKLDLPEGKEHDVARRVAEIACDTLGVLFEDTSVVFTGNGVQLFVHTVTPITDDTYFDRARAAYGVLCKRIQSALDVHGVSGSLDTSVWSKARLMRLPNTINRKPNKPERRSYIISQGGKQVRFDVVEQSGVALVNKGEYIPDEILKNYPVPDTKAVCTGCKFLAYCKEKPGEVNEPQWYAMTSITARLDDGAKLTHEYSHGHPDYNAYETDNKIEQALVAAGPRTCKDIESRWGGCNTCEHYNKITSPIMLKGPDYIASVDFGFRERKTSNGKVIPGRVLIADLKKQFAIEHIYKVIKDSSQVIIYKATHWEYISDIEIRAWVMTKVFPEPSVNDMNEFVGSLKAHNVTSFDELDITKDGFINFSNLVLNVRTGETHRHNPDFGFFDVRPYAYDPRATSPIWDKFLLDIMSNDVEKVQLLKEYAGYCISNDDTWLQKAMILNGAGSNGKSVFIEMLGEVVGEKSHAGIPLKELSKDTMRHYLINKLFNYSEETNIKSFADADIFKTIVAGGVTTVKQLYVQPFITKLKCKLVLACNEIPRATDVTHGFLRRLIIVNFEETFTPGDGKHDHRIKERLRNELPGICNSIIKAYKECKDRGQLIEVKSVQRALEVYQTDNDPVCMFFNDVLIPADESEHVKTSEVYAEYRMMCEVNGFIPLSSPWFGRSLTKYTKQVPKTMRIGEAVHRVLTGYRLNKDY